MIEQLKTIREAFESTQLKRECRRLPNGDYENSFVNSAWRHFQAGVGAANDMTKGQKPVAWLCIVNTADAGPTKFFTAPSDPRGFPVYAAPVAQQYEAGDVASAAAQGFRDGVASVTQQPQAEKRCQYCDGTGDVHSIDGQWRGECHCQKQPQAETDQATMAGLDASVNILSSLVDEQRQLLAEVDAVFGVDAHGIVFEDGDSALIDRVRSHLAATNEAQQPQAEVGNSGFDHKTAADFLSGKIVSDEAVRKFVQAARWAHDDRASLQSMLLSVRNELASREAEIALLKKELMDADAAPQQAEAVPSDVARDAERWRTFLATRPANTHAVINDAIDAAMAKGEKS